MKFIKLHGAGNDYLFIDGHQKEYDWPTLARVMSDRHFGVGSDGVIIALPSDKAQVRMRMFNADGSEGEMCGNGIRCFARYVTEMGITEPVNGAIQVETGAGILSVIPVFEKNKMVRAKVSMGEPHFKSAEIPVNIPSVSDASRVWDYPLEVDGHKLQISCVSMGNPHAIAFLEDSVDTFPLETIGPKVEHDPMFPRRVNFEIVNIIDASRIKARVWERGSGITLACGTGACAISVASSLHGYTGKKVDISLPGGVLTVEWSGNGEVVLEGPIEEVFEGYWPD